MSTSKADAASTSRAGSTNTASDNASAVSEDADDAFLAELRSSPRDSLRRGAAIADENLFDGSSTEAEVRGLSFEFGEETNSSASAPSRQPEPATQQRTAHGESESEQLPANDGSEDGEVPSDSLPEFERQSTPSADDPSVVDDDEYLRRLREGTAVKKTDEREFEPSSASVDDVSIDGAQKDSSSASSMPMVDFSESPVSGLFDERPVDVDNSGGDPEPATSADEEYETGATRVSMDVGKQVDFGDIKLNLGIAAWYDAASFHHEAYEVHPLPRLPKTCYFTDSDKRIDLVIMYDPKKGGKERHRNKVYRKNFALKLQALGLEVETSLCDGDKQGYMKIHAPWEFLTRNAEMIGVTAPIGFIEQPKKPSCTTSLVNLCKCCLVDGRDVFRRKKEIDRPIQPCYYMRFERSRLRFFIGNRNHKTFFSAVQRIQVVSYVVQRVTLRRLKRRWQADADKIDQQNDEEFEDSVSFHWLKENGVLGDEFPLHDCGLEEDYKDTPVQTQPLRRWLLDHWGSWTNCFRYQPLDQVRAYFGAQIGMYFAWLGFYTKWLLVPAIASLICLLFGIRSVLTDSQSDFFCSPNATSVILCRSCRSVVCPFTNLLDYCTLSRFGAMFDNELTCVFAVVVSLWSVVFIEYWKRYQNILDSRWETSYGADMQNVPRPQFLLNVRTKRLSPITMEEEPYVRKREKMRRVVSSITIIASTILLLLGFLVATIMYRTVAAVIIAYENVLPSVSPSLLASVTSAVMNLVVIQFMSFIYPRIARRMTEQERPRTEEDFETSYTYKVVCFQYINFYGSLFYLAFLRGRFDVHPSKSSFLSGKCSPAGCLVDLSIQLIIIMTVKQIIQNLIEVLQPKIVNLISRLRKRTVKKGQSATRWESDSLLGPNKSPVGFNDYLEMMIQYGFITMFSPAFPLAAFFAWLNNILEIRIDASKYLVDERRINPQPVRNIGPWQDVIEVTTRVSVVVNAFIIAFTSQTIDNIYFSTVFEDSGNSTSYFHFQFSRLDLLADDIDESLLTNNYTHCFFRGMFNEDGTDRYYVPHLLLVRLAFVLIFEHAVFVLQSVIQAAVPDMPEVVKTTELREKYLVHQKFMEQEFGDDYEEKLEANAIKYEDKPRFADSFDRQINDRASAQEMVETDEASTAASPGLAVASVPTREPRQPVRSRLLRKIRRKQVTPAESPKVQLRLNSVPIDLDEVDSQAPSEQNPANGGIDRRSSLTSAASTLKKNHGQKKRKPQKRGHFIARVARRLC